VRPANLAAEGVEAGQALEEAAAVVAVALQRRHDHQVLPAPGRSELAQGGAEDRIRPDLHHRVDAGVEQRAGGGGEVDGLADVAGPVGAVDLARRGEAPAGAKSGDPVELGTLFVTIASSGALTALINTANSWIGRRRRGSIRVKIGNDELVLTGASSEHQRRVIEEWLARRSDG
jgi:hypothetical protein